MSSKRQLKKKFLDENDSCMFQICIKIPVRVRRQIFNNYTVRKFGKQITPNHFPTLNNFQGHQVIQTNPKTSEWQRNKLCISAMLSFPTPLSYIDGSYTLNVTNYCLFLAIYAQLNSSRSFLRAIQNRSNKLLVTCSVVSRDLALL